MLLVHGAEGVAAHGVTACPARLWVCCPVSWVHQECRDQDTLLVMLLCRATSLPCWLWLLEQVGARHRSLVTSPCQGHLCGSLPFHFSLPAALSMSPEAEDVPQSSHGC